jgi:uncharacterized protein YdgA (DUF945 family)
MKRWVVALLVLLAVIVLVSPGIVGQLAERNLKDSIRWAGSESDELVVTEESFERHWFTAEGRHRIELKDGELRSRIADLAGLEEQDPVPALIVDTRIDHGLVPVTSMSRESGSLMPGLASTVSTMQLDPGDGELIDLPGRLYSQVGLTGGTASRYLLEAGSFNDGGARLEWEGADVSMTADRLRRNLQYEGTVRPLFAVSGDQSVRLGLTTIEGENRQTDYGFMVGDLVLRVDSMSVGADAAAGIEIGELTVDASSDIIDERVNGKTTMTVEDFSMPGFGDVDVAMDVAANGLEARSMQAIITALQHARNAEDPSAALTDLYPRIESDVQKFLSSGAELRIDRLDVTLPQGEVTSRLHFELPEADPDAVFTWPALILALTASADVRLPVALMELAEAANPQSGALIAMGILRKDGDSYIVNAEYQKGLLTVNGAPMPIPLPGR